MNYPESAKILERIKNSKNILVNCHRSPDPDSVGSALSFYHFLKKLGKDVKIISPDVIHPNFKFLPGSSSIERVDFSNVDYSKFDLFISLDSSSWDQCSGVKDLDLPRIPMIVIDHHSTNLRYGQVNLVDDVASSNCEVIFNLFKDWEVEITPDMATILLTGIYSDTVSFNYIKSSLTLRTASELIDIGADYEQIVINISKSNEPKLLNLYGEMLRDMKVDNNYNFVYVAVPYEIFEKYGKPMNAKSEISGLFFNSVKNTDFGIVMVEQRKNVLNLSLRSRTVGFDVSKIAQELGGSGHKAASGAWFDFKNFDEAVEKVLEVARKYAKKTS